MLFSVSCFCYFLCFPPDPAAETGCFRFWFSLVMISAYNYALSILQSSEIVPLPSSHGKLSSWDKVLRVVWHDFDVHSAPRMRLSAMNLLLRSRQHLTLESERPEGRSGDERNGRTHLKQKRFDIANLHNCLDTRQREIDAGSAQTVPYHGFASWGVVAQVRSK